MPIDRAPDFAKIKRALVGELRRAISDARTIMLREVKERYSGPTGPEGTGRLAVRSNTLRSRVRHEITGTARTGLEARVYIRQTAGGFDPVYARIHETGGIIKPKKGRFLIIPTRRSRTAAGVSAGRSPRHHPEGFFVRRGQRLFFAVKSGRAIRVLFTLKKRVRIPRRPVWAQARHETAPKIRQRFRTAVDRALRISG
jgi:hypothetical protein